MNGQVGMLDTESIMPNPIKKCTESKIDLVLVTSLTAFDKHYVKMIALENEWFCFLIKILQRPISLPSTYF